MGEFTPSAASQLTSRSRIPLALRHILRRAVQRLALCADCLAFAGVLLAFLHEAVFGGAVQRLALALTALLSQDCAMAVPMGKNAIEAAEPMLREPKLDGAMCFIVTSLYPLRSWTCASDHEIVVSSRHRLGSAFSCRYGAAGADAAMTTDGLAFGRALQAQYRHDQKTRERRRNQNSALNGGLAIGRAVAGDQPGAGHGGRGENQVQAVPAQLCGADQVGDDLAERLLSTDSTAAP